MNQDKYETRIFIDNEFRPGKNGDTFEITNPTTGNPVCQVHAAGPEDVDSAVAAAQEAFESWSTLSAFARAAPLSRLAELIRRDAEKLAHLDSVCMGKPVELLKAMDIRGCAGTLEYFAGSANHIVGDSSLSTPNFLNVSVRQPYGVCGLIIPWNVPMIMFAFKVGPALICGNTVVLKSSEKAPLSSLKLAALAREAGLPKGVLNVVNGFGLPTGQAMGLHRKIRKISFTGSVNTGRQILKMAAESNLKDVSLELGGKSPAIIFEDADIEAAARYTHFSIHHNSGQHCQANSRIIVHESIAHQYVESLRSLMSGRSIGDPADSTTFQGPQVDETQLSRILRLVESGARDGKVVLGGSRAKGEKGSFMEPTILLDVPATSPAHKEEIFGPVVLVNTFKEEAEALAMANEHEYGLFGEIIQRIDILDDADTCARLRL